MNTKLEEYARTQIKEGLAQCSDEQVLLFKRMYSNWNLNASIDEAVDAMDIDRLDTAMNQIERTLENNYLT